MQCDFVKEKIATKKLLLSLIPDEFNFIPNSYSRQNN